MREPEMQNGDYVPDGSGGIQAADGLEALAARVRFRLTARRGQFPFLPELGSRLWQLGRLRSGERQAAAEQYVAEALAGEDVQVETVSLEERGGGVFRLHAELRQGAETLRVSADVI